LIIIGKTYKEYGTLFMETEMKTQNGKQNNMVVETGLYSLSTPFAMLKKEQILYID